MAHVPPPLRQDDDNAREVNGMTNQDVIEVLGALDRAGIGIWVDGGWGVDALIGDETRRHADLDLAVDRAILDDAQAALEELGFQHDPAIKPGLPARLVMRDERGRQVDFHPLVFDVEGDGWQQFWESGRAWGRYPAEHLEARGTIGGRPVRCLSAELQVSFHLSHDWTEADEHDLRLLAESFEDVHVPPPFWDVSQTRPVGRPPKAPRVGALRDPGHEMEAEVAVSLIDALEAAGVQVWVDGGWGVDALLARQTRAHDDLDLVVSLADVPKLKDVFAKLGFVALGGGAPMSFELLDSDGRQVDVHPVTFDDQGGGVYLARSGEKWVYPAAGFKGTGSILGRKVQCLTPEVQVLCHTGYELDADDRADMHALHEKFGVELSQETTIG
jgi:lincosamide nucleotidyltransferase A/C/D/E